MGQANAKEFGFEYLMSARPQCGAGGNVSSVASIAFGFDEIAASSHPYFGDFATTIAEFKL